MSSSPKHSMSSARRLKYGGQNGKGELLDAINFLFQIKGRDYMKKHNDFIIPSADEFLTYATKVNDEFKKLKKTSPVRKAFAFPCSKPTRPISVHKGHGGQSIDDFLYYVTPWVHGTDVTNQVLQCFTLVIYALVNYHFVKESLLIHAEHGKMSPTETFHHAANAISSISLFSEPFHWFIHNTMTVFTEYSEQLFSVLYSYACEKIVPLLSKQMVIYTFPSDGIAASLGSATTSVISTLMMVPQAVDYCITLPIFSSLVRHGYEDCKTVCNEALMRCKMTKEDVDV